MDVLIGLEGFDWDAGNSEKSWGKHKVTRLECEEVFFNNALVVMEDEAHSSTEKRYGTLGKTGKDRKLFVVFTVRNRMIRIISARDMNRKEKVIYEEAERNSKI